jgi:vacuolar-type H+-ATPase subunit I/STV1
MADSPPNHQEVWKNLQHNHHLSKQPSYCTMSITISRERVQRILGVAQTGVEEISRELTSSACALSSEAENAIENALESFESEIASEPVSESESLVGCEALSEIQSATRKQVREELDGEEVSEVEAIQAETIGALEAAGHLNAEDAGSVAETLGQLAEAESVTEARELREETLSEANQIHRQAFVGGVADAVQEASMTVGFSNVEVSEGPTGDTRVVAENEKGQAIITEIHDDGDGDPSLASEVVGVFDGSCHEIMEEFEAVLVANGIRASSAATWETQGRCKLDAARDYAAEKYGASEEHVTDDSGDSSNRKRQRQRQQGTARQHQ